MPLSETRLDCSALAGSTAPQADRVYKWLQDVGLKDPQQEVTRYRQRTDAGLQDSQQQRTDMPSATERLCICIFGLYRRYTNRIIIIIIISRCHS